MRYLLTESERQAVLAGIWAEVKHIPAPRKVRLLLQTQLWNEWYANFRSRSERQGGEPSSTTVA